MLHRGPQPGAWPQVLVQVSPGTHAADALPAPSPESLGLSVLTGPAVAIPPSPAVAGWGMRPSGRSGDVRAAATWSPVLVAAVAAAEPELPAPSSQSFSYPFVVSPAAALPVVRTPAAPARRTMVPPKTHAARHAKHVKARRIAPRRTADKPDVTEAMPRHSATDNFFTHQIR